MRTIFLLLLCVLGACASTQGTYSPGATSTRAIEVSSMEESRTRFQISSASAGGIRLESAPEAVWATLPAVYSAIGLAGSVVDARRLIFGQPELTIRRRLGDAPLSRLLDCGSRAGIANADTYTVRLNVRTQIQADGEGGTRMQTQVDGLARPQGTNDAWVRCGSTHELERRIEQLVRLSTSF